MRMMFVLVALLWLAAHPAMAAPPDDMVLVPAGEFSMGSPEGDPDEKPAHKVQISAFFMDKYEVTVKQYAAFLQESGGDRPAEWKTMNKTANQNRPVMGVDWAEAARYCKWAGKRLPTEVEWEKAARGTDDRLYPWGNDPPTPLHANFGKSDWSNHGVLAPIGSFGNGKSPYGIYDMAGNVWEWVNDWYDYNYYKNSPSQSPTGPSSGGAKVIRGGAWNSNPRAMRSSNRSLTSPTDQGLTGFRCAKTP